MLLATREWGWPAMAFLSHRVSCSSCGPPQASWAVDGSSALGPRTRWKPSSAPTLPGKPPPQGCPATCCWAGGTLPTPQQPSSFGLHSWWEREGGGRGHGAVVGSTQVPAIQPAAPQMPLPGSTPLPPEQFGGQLFSPGKSVSPSSLTPWPGQ